jgi:transcriptional regulator
VYIPEPFALTDREEIRALLRDYAFAVLVTALDGAPPLATHLPLIHTPEAGPNGTLTAHMARANPQWRDLAHLQETGGEALVIFQGPHAYVSPRWYGPGPAVPTWNYTAVHAYGTPRLIEDAAAARAHVEALSAAHESGAAEPWRLDSQEESYTRAKIRGIVAFEIPIARLEAKAKLNQNRTPAARQGVIAALAEGENLPGREVAKLMRRNESDVD